MSKEKTQEVLNQTVADLSQAAALVHQTHWYMRGSGFLTLHPKMDEFMDGLNEHLDEFAERLITIGGSPVSTLKEFDEKSKIELQPAMLKKQSGCSKQNLDNKKRPYRICKVFFYYPFLIFPGQLFKPVLRI